jgi:hypothetical protein
MRAVRTIREFFTEERWAPWAMAGVGFVVVMVVSLGFQDQGLGDALWDAVPWAVGSWIGTYLVSSPSRGSTPEGT